MPNPLNIKNFTKTFGDIKAVQNLNLTIKKGEIFSLIGPNGSGKTTIIKSIAGLLRPTAGQIKINGLDTISRPEETKSIIGYIPDNPEIWSYITGEEFLYMIGAFYGMSKQKTADRIPALLRIFALNGIEKHYFQDYSRGNKQKFTILAALLHSPDLLLIDEPIVGLDPISADIAQKEFKKFTSKGGAILMATHTLEVAENISNRIGFLKEGKIKASGNIRELKEKAGLGQKTKLNNIYKKLT
jgi:ABC-2 type transport system ATP-binding protein